MWIKKSEKTKILLILSIIIILSKTTFAQTFSESFQPFNSIPRNYICYQTRDSISIDGKLSEPAWQQAAWTEDFKDIEGDAKPMPALRTRVKMLWDEKYLYIAAVLQEPHVWGTLLQHDTIIFQDNDFEVFIDPDGDTHHYYEIEINALNTVMDLFMDKPYRNGGNAMLNWDTKGIRTAVHVNGTINQPGDTDQDWTVEMAIPFSALRFFGDRRPPADSTIWRINFSRVEWDTDIRNNQYVKRRQPEHNWVWSPQGIINMHAPERWGYLQFSTQAAGEGQVAFQLPEQEYAKKLLWLVYYKQQAYSRAHGRFAASLRELGIPARQKADNGKAYTLQLEGISRQYDATLSGGGLPAVWGINQEGKIYSIRK
ncbi:carbohydrate-binding family 9-like protein [Chitinophaga vietnamensis]|uniref:carbohydrate-binding family 9-like protein n=1 Tax=Chitinophaga vietnamensis TaxID=2593957 RepID=UPI001178014F|nr:carbohydrate-binding family 9-like protein [Chitinophaga vietnamensis]